MTGTIILLGILLLLGAALEYTHRRTAGRWHPGRDARSDRDAARLAQELDAVAQRDSLPDPRIVHLAPPTSAATDARLITRTAA